jgi:hypothetical protein
MASSALLPAAITAFVGEIARQVLMASAARARARRQGATAVYRVTLVGRLVFDAAILVLGGLAAIVIYQGDDWRIAALLGGFAMLCVFGYPGPVVLDSRGLQTRRWYGRPVRIEWHDVADMRVQTEVGQTTVVSRDGHFIVHTSLHADSLGFRAEVRWRAQLTPRVVPQ